MPAPINTEVKNHWIVGLCLVEFDIDVGQQVNQIMPDGCLTAQEKADVAFHAFPVSLCEPCMVPALPQAHWWSPAGEGE